MAKSNNLTRFNALGAGYALPLLRSFYLVSFS